METLHITTIRKSPLTLSDIGLKDGDLVTIKTLAEMIAENRELGLIPVSWIKSYVSDKLGHDYYELFDYMFDTWKGENND